MSPASSLILRYRRVGGAWQSIPVQEGNFLIGRGSDCYLRLVEGKISRHHAEIKRRGDWVWIADLGSANGTRVNGKRLKGQVPQQLLPGQTIEIGNFSLVLEVSGAAPSGRIPASARGRAPGHIFISYSRQNSDLVYPCVEKLAQSGFNIWIDRQDISPGRPWRGQIVQAIHEADAFILLLSPHAAASENVCKELDIAIEAKVLVLPIILQPVQTPVAMKYQLIDLQYIDLFDNPKLGFSQLVNALHECQEALALQPERVRQEYLQGELIIPAENVSEYYQEKQQRLINYLARVTSISPRNISIASLAAGSVRVIVNMPAAAAYELKAQALNGNPTLLEAGISALRLVGDSGFIQIGGATPPGVAGKGEPPGPSPPSAAPPGGGLKLFLLMLGAIAAVIAGIIIVSNIDDGVRPGSTRIAGVTEPSSSNVTREDVIPSPIFTPTRRSSSAHTPTRFPTSTPTPREPPTRTPTQRITSTPTSIITRTRTASPTEAEAICAPFLTVEMNAHCREGPGTVYDVANSLPAGETTYINGQNQNTMIKWWWIQPPNSSRQCWISDVTVSTHGDLSCLPVIPAPPTPTPTPRDDPPSAPVLIQPSDLASISCYSYSTTVDFIWSEVTDPSGIARYEWVLEQDDPYNGYTIHDSASTTSTSRSVSVDCYEDYRWRVRAVDGAGNTGDYSEYYSFTLY